VHERPVRFQIVRFDLKLNWIGIKEYYLLLFSWYLRSRLDGELYCCCMCRIPLLKKEKSCA
jgi:hypothetical protein